jgi:hypothetical protein
MSRVSTEEGYLWQAMAVFEKENGQALRVLQK